MDEKKAKPGVFSVARGEEIETLTRAGWQLVEAYEVDEAMPTTRQYAPEPNQFNAYPATQMFYESELGKSRRFLLRLDEGSVIGSLGDDLKTARVRLAEAETQKKASDEAAARLRADVASLEKALESARNATNAELARAVALGESVRKLEADLGRVRGEIGAERFRKIVGQP